MPIALDGDTVDVYLARDESRPIETRPAFVCRYLTSRQMRDYKKALFAWAKATDDKKDADTVAGLAIATLKIAIADTKNLPDKPLDELLSDAEMWELLNKIPEEITLSEVDKKKLPSPSPLNAANSVASALAESVTTPPNPTPPTT